MATTPLGLFTLITQPYWDYLVGVQPFQTELESFLAKGLRGLLEVNLTNADYTLSSDESQTLVLKFEGDLGGANRTVKIPLTGSRFFLLWNDTEDPAFHLTIKTTASGSVGIDLSTDHARIVFVQGDHIRSIGPEWLPTFSGYDPDDLPAGINAGKIADGSVSNTEFQYINSLTSNVQTQLNAKEAIANKDTDGTLAANSDTKYPSQKAVRTFVENAVTGLLEFKGSTNCSGNPNYPAASKGDAYVVTVAGKIGGASGKSVDIGDVYVASADNAGGTDASVGTSWFILEHNLVGALLSANNLSDMVSAPTARTNLGLVIGTDVEAHDADLTTIAGLSAANNDLLQRKSGAWTNRTLAQVLSDLGLTSSSDVAFNSVEAPVGFTIEGDTIIKRDELAGMHLEWVSGTSLKVKSGWAYIQSLGRCVFSSSDITKSSLSLAANTLFYVYFYLNSGSPDIEITTTAQAAAYFADAKSKTSDTSKRYIGAIRTDGSGNVYNFQHVGDTMRYMVDPTVSPFQLVTGGTATTETDIYCKDSGGSGAAALVPAGTREVLLFLQNYRGDQLVCFGSSLDSVTGGAGHVGNPHLPVAPGSTTPGPPEGSAQYLTFMILDSLLKLTYWWFAAITTGAGAGLYVNLLGYKLPR